MARVGRDHGLLRRCMVPRHRQLVALSEQQVGDCDTVDFGCNGELINHGFAFAEENAMCTETVTAIPQQRALAWLPVPPPRSPREVSRNTKTFTDSKQTCNVASGTATCAHIS